MSGEGEVKAGRELNVAVARDVMGWLEYDGLSPISSTPRGATLFQSDRAFGSSTLQVWSRTDLYYFDPSTRIEDAFKAVDRLNESGWRLSLAHEGGLSDQWVASFIRNEGIDDEEFTGDCLAPTASEAVCRAARETLAR